MAARKKKRFWNEGGIDWTPHPERLPQDPLPPLTPAGRLVFSPRLDDVAPTNTFECLRCVELDADEEPSVPDHSPSCPYRVTLVGEPDR